MNKDIQTLIEREAEKYANKTRFLSDFPHCEKSEKNGFQAGASFALSLFKWRKVSEVLPENQNIVLVKTNKGCFATAYLHGKESGFIIYGDEAYREFGEVTEWMPIPQID